jgi:excisionase family DNA binding protein
MDKKFLNIEEAAELLQINPKKLYELAREGKLPSTKITGKWLFPLDELVRYLNFSSLSNLKDRYRLTPSAGKLMLMAGSDDPLFTLMLSWFNESPENYLIFYSNIGSKRGLTLLKNGLVHASVSHIYDPETDSYNINAMRKSLENPEEFTVVNIFKREIGFISRNSKIDSFKQIVENKLIFVNRPKNTGTRVLVDFLLKSENINSNKLIGYETEVDTHFEVAELIATRKADVGLSNGFYAPIFGLTFTPVKTEDFDIILHKDFYFSEEFQSFLTFLTSEETKEKIGKIAGYFFDVTGKIKA